MKKQIKRPADNLLKAIPSEEEVLNKIPFSEEVSKRLIHQFTQEQLQKAFPEDGNTSIIRELIATGEAAFEFIWYSEMDLDLKNAFHQLRRLYNLYARLALTKSE